MRTSIEEIMAAVDANVIAVTVDLPAKRVNRLAYRRLAGLCHVETSPSATTYRLKDGAGDGQEVEDSGHYTSNCHERSNGSLGGFTYLANAPIR